MGELILLELKKLCRKKLTVVVTLVCFLATILFFLLPYIQFRAWDENGKELLGKEAVRYRKECYQKISGPLTDERIAKDLREYQENYQNPDNLIQERGGEVTFRDEIYFGYLAPKKSYLDMLGNTYNNNQAGYLNIPGISEEERTDFYSVRNKNVNAAIENDKNLSDAEKKYWKEKNTQIREPYEYGYPLGWSTFGDTVQMLVVCILGICISVAPMFAGEYQSGTDAVILSTRYGKSRLVHAKIISALLYGTVVFAVNAAVALLMPLLTFGAEGGNLPLQIMDSSCPYALTFSQAAFILIGIDFFIMAGLTAITLFCSSRMKSSFPVLIIDVLLIFLPVFLSPGSNQVWNHIYALLPYQSSSGISQFKEYLSYGLGNIVVNLFGMTAAVYLAITLVALPLAGRNFKRHQVH